MSNNSEQIQVFFELAMSIGSSLDLKNMIMTSLKAYLRKLNCSSGVVLQLFKTEADIYFYKSILSIPYKTKFSKEFNELYKLIPKKSGKKILQEFYSKLPITKKINENDYLYLLNLPDYGLICLRKNEGELPHEILYTMRSLNTKFAQACIACVKNSNLIIAKERTEESDKLKTTFIENISHEIRTPLNSIVGYSSLIADKQISPKMLPSACKAIVSGSNDLLKMIEGLLDISLLKSGNLKLKYNLFNPNQLLIDQERVFFKHVSVEHKEQLNFRVVTSLKDFFIISDEIRLKQIFDNLISNAVRFSENGEVEIGYLVDEKNAKDKMSANITFYIKDSGIGIPIERQKDIFNPFICSEHSGLKIFRGAGVGLTITKRLIELLEGEISVESEPNKGTTMLFTIPIITTVDELIVDL